MAELGALLERVATTLDVSIADQRQAVERYSDLGHWLADRDPGRVAVDIYPQGSFRLGTVVRPSDPSGDFDIDLVFQRDLSKQSVTQEELREAAGALLQEYCTDCNLDPPLELGRCWRLEFFEDGFHLDVLPVIPDRENEYPTGILLSDRDLRHWLPSNPIGYADWFFSRMNQAQLQEQLVALAKSLDRSVEEVPKFLVRTPLQRIVQLLKRDRDLQFHRDRDRQPPSILITTLAAQVYKGETDVLVAVRQAAANLMRAVEERDGVWWVENPAHAGENFADKWNTDPERRQAFLEWLAGLNHRLDTAVEMGNIHTAARELAGRFGSVAEEAAQHLEGAAESVSMRAADGHGRAPGEELIEDRFPVDLRHQVTVTVDVQMPGQLNRYERRRALRRRRLPPERTLIFKVASTTTPPPFQVYWKVRNFGRVALQKGQLRGKLARDFGRDGEYSKTETTRYPGEHYVDCYVVKDGRCVARTREWVPIDANSGP